jgi:hypothetical protein
MIFTNTIHGFGCTVPIKNDGPKGGFGKSRILWGTNTGRISTAILLGKVAILGGIIKWSRHDVSALSTCYQVAGIQTIGIETIGTGVEINNWFIFFEF